MNYKKVKTSSLMRRNLNKFFTNRLAITGLVITTLLITAAIFAPLLTSYNPALLEPASRLHPPSPEHWLGTDRVGRDLVARLLYGGRVSIFVGLASAIMASAIGVVLGCISGYYGGKADYILVYISEIFMSFPQIMLIMIVVSFTGQGLFNLILIFSLTGWANALRIVRGKILSLKEEAFVESCRANGVGGTSIMFSHLLPNTLGPIIVNITLSTAGYVLAESGLSFLGLGVPSEISTWGNIINAAKSLDIVQNYPVLWIAPGAAISLFVLGINFLGDGLRDAFDPAQ